MAIAITPDTPLYYGLGRGIHTDPSTLTVVALPAGNATLAATPTPGVPVRIVHDDILDIEGIGRFRVHCPRGWTHTPTLRAA